MEADEALATCVEALRARNLPSVSAAVVDIHGSLHRCASGWAQFETPRAADPATQYRLGSITKTFVAALTVQLADECVIGLDDPIGHYLGSDFPLPAPTARQLLTHTGGVGREIPTGLWASFKGPDREQFLASLSGREQIHPPGRQWHYSNLGFCLIGEALRVATGQDPKELIRQRFLAPLGLWRTSWQPRGEVAHGMWVDPERLTTHAERPFELGAMDIATGLWGTAADVAAWGHALTGRRPEVVSPAVVAQMFRPHTVMYDDDWSKLWGLGLQLRVRAGSQRAGQNGALPGFLGRLSIDLRSKAVSAFLTNAGTGINPPDAADELLDSFLAVTPGCPAPGPGDAIDAVDDCPTRYLDLLGEWWSEGFSSRFWWARGHLQSERHFNRVSHFLERSVDSFACSDGPNNGERLVVHRKAGRILTFDWGGYLFTRTPYQRRQPMLAGDLGLSAEEGLNVSSPAAPTIIETSREEK